MTTLPSDIWRADPVSFAVHLTRELPKHARYIRRPHLTVLGRALQSAFMGNGKKRVMVTMPPRHGKSTTTSEWFPLWVLDQDPTKRVVLSSYEASFAASWGAKVRAHADTYADQLSFQRPGRGSAEDWKTGVGVGGMVTAGVGGAITGKGADVFIIDDPVKNAEEANSATMREKAWDWYRSTAFTRLEPGGVVVLVMTRWHEDDLGGRVLEQMRAAQENDDVADIFDEEEWEVVDMPAIAEEDDPIGRKPGEALWPDRYSESKLAGIKKVVGPWVWSALYQQKPAPAEGEIFQRSWFRYYSRAAQGRVLKFHDGRDRLVPLDKLQKFVTVDVATSTKTTADYFVASEWGVDRDANLFLLGVTRDRLPGPEQLPTLRASSERWNFAPIGIEKVAFQLSLIQNAIADGLPAVEVEVDSDKVSRAQLAAARCAAGAVYWDPTMPGIDEWEKELLAFPRGAHDDQVDTFSMAAHAVATGSLLKRKKHGKIALDDKALRRSSRFGIVR